MVLPYEVAIFEGEPAECQEENVLPAALVGRTNRHLKNVIEQDRRRVEQ